MSAGTKTTVQLSAVKSAAVSAAGPAVLIELKALVFGTVELVEPDAAEVLGQALIRSAAVARENAKNLRSAG